MIEVNCPNKNSEWKAYVKLIGDEKQATAYWMANGDTIPDSKQLEELGFGKRSEAPKFQALITDIQQKKQALQGRLASINSSIKKASGDERLKLREVSIGLTRKITDLETQSVDLRKTEALEDIEPYAETQLAEVRNILNKDELSFSDLTNTLNTIKLWQKAGDFSDDHLFFTEEELEAGKGNSNAYMRNIVDKFKKWQTDAEFLNEKWERQAYNLLEKTAKEVYGENANIDFKKALKDIGIVKALTLDISETDSTLYQLISTLVHNTSLETHQEAEEVFKQHEELLKELEKQGYKLKDVYELFQQEQSNTDTRKTGNLTYRFSQAFFDYTYKLRNKLESELKYADEGIADPKAKNEHKKKAITEFNTELRKHEITFDVRKLFPDAELYSNKIFNSKEIEEHKRDLITQLGQKGYDTYYSIVEEKLQQYKETYESQKNFLATEYGEDVLGYQTELEAWEKQFSPYYVAESLVDGITQKVGGQYIRSSSDYIKTVPRRIVDGKSTEFYDKKFEKIEADDKILALHSYLIDLFHELNASLPEEKKANLQINSIPYIAKSLLEAYTTAGINQGLTPVLDLITKELRSEDLSEVSPTIKRDVEGKEIMSLQTSFLADPTQRIKDYINLKAIEYKQKTGSEPTRDQMLEWKKDAQNDLAKEKTMDLGKVLRVYTAGVLAYKHKSRIEDAMNVANMVIDNAIEQQVNGADKSLIDEYGKPIVNKGLPHMKSQLEATMKHFYGYPTRKTEGQFTSKKIYTKQESREKAKIEELKANNQQALKEGKIKKKDFIETEKALNKQLDKLGGRPTAGNMVDGILKYIQLKGMGWNVFAGICNVGFGMPSNYIEASGGQRFNTEELNKAYRMSLSVFGGELTSTGKKIESIMKKYDILAESRNEIFNKTPRLSLYNKLSQKFKWLNPYHIQSRTEFLNQAPVMLAMMMHNKIVTNSTGKKVTMLEAMDDLGNLKEGYTLDRTEELRIVEKIKEAIREIHGNYDPDATIAGKQYVFFRALSQFKTWAFMGFNSRFGTETPSNITGFTKKGRYRSYGALYSNLGAINGTFTLTKQLLRKLAFQKTNFDELGFSETDAANLRKNLTEIVVFLTVNALGLLLKAGLGDDDEDKKNLKYIIYPMINSMNRVETDLMFYTSPLSFQALQKNTIPAFSIVTDAQKLMINSTNLLLQLENKRGHSMDIYESGIHKGRSKTMVSFENMFPGLVVGNRLKTLSTTIMGQNK